jgi:hypothetical protein
MKVSFLPATILLATAPFSARAVVLIDSSGITATSNDAFGAAFQPSNTLDGLTTEGFQNTGTVGPPERPAGHQNNHWITPDSVLSSAITFDLGGSYDLVQISVLNTSNTNWNDRETDTFTIQTSTDGGTSYSAPGAPISLQDYTLGFQEVGLVADGVTHVRLNVTNDPAAGVDTGTADVAVGLNEVQFFQAIPEPASLLLLAAGPALLLRRSRRR